MQKDDEDHRPSSRRNSPRRNSLKKERSLEERDKKCGEQPTSSANTTPKKVVRGSSVVDFMVTGKQIGKRSDRANSLPGRSRAVRGRRPCAGDTARDVTGDSLDDVTLDLSQFSDFEDTNSKYGICKMAALATSTPKPRPGPKPRSASLQSHISHITNRTESRRSQKSLDEAKTRDSVFSCSRDSLYKTSSSASPYRPSTEAEYSVSPEYSTQSSLELSPRAPTDLALSPLQHSSSCCVSSWCGCTVTARGGEWDHFWHNYNHSLHKVPMKSYYDQCQCPTPYRTEDIDLNDFDFTADTPRKRSPDNIDNINNIIRNEGLQLTPRETQNIIKCAHILGNVLSKAIERRSKHLEKGDEIKETRKNLTLDLKETAIPLQVKEEKRCETVTTQTDISLPNTKSAPRIFENILRQLSKSSIDEGDETVGEEKAEEEKDKEC